MTDYKPGEAVLYKTPGSEDYQLGIVKRVTDRGCFVYYHTGDTAAMTGFSNLRKIQNLYAFRIERITAD